MGPDSKQLVVLVVDDDPLVVDLLETSWAPEADITVLRAKNGDALPPLLVTTPIDCLLLDYDLGVEDGLTLMSRLRGAGLVLPPVVMMTGAGSELIAVEAFRSGVVDYVVKRDLSIEGLLRTVRRAAATRSMARGAAPDRHPGRGGLAPDPHPSPSRRQLEQHLRLAGSSHSRQDFAVLALTPRGFDGIVRSCGADVARDVEREMGMRLAELTRAEGISGLWQHGVLVCVVDHAATRNAVLELCRHLLENLSFPYSANGRLLAVEAEIGAAFSSAGADSGLSALAKALAAMEHCDLLDRPVVAAFAIDEEQFSDLVLRRTARSDEVAPDLDRPPARQASSPAVASTTLNEPGQMEIDSSHVAIDCVLTGLSSAGARLRLADVAAAPARFRLVIPGAEVDRDAWLQWQVGREAGVSFLNNRRGQTVTEFLPIQIELGARFIERTREELQSVPLDAAALESAAQRAEIHRLVHRIAGTAGSFGFTLIGDEAMRLQYRLAETGDDIVEIAAALNRIRVLVESGARR